jgi:hypothetical protein
VFCLFAAEQYHILVGGLGCFMAALNPARLASRDRGGLAGVDYGAYLVGNREHYRDRLRICFRAGRVGSEEWSILLSQYHRQCLLLNQWYIQQRGLEDTLENRRAPQTEPSSPTDSEAEFLTVIRL